MTYFIYELENTKARLILSTTRTTDAEFAKMIEEAIKTRGNIAVVETEN